MSELKKSFENVFPRLKIEFAFDGNENLNAFSFHHCFPFIPIDELCASCPENGLDIADEMTITEVEELFREKFHLPVKIFIRKDGYWQKDASTGKLVLAKMSSQLN